MENSLLTPKDVARLLNVSKAMAYKLIAQGQISAIRFGKTVRVKADELNRFVENCTISTHQPQSSIAQRNDPSISRRNE